MKKCLFILFLIICGCEKKTTIDSSNLYRKKADALINQILLPTEKDTTDFPTPVDYQNLCTCVYQMSNESFVYEYEAEMPNLNIKKVIIKDLKFKNERELDSVIKISKNYKFDFSSLQEYLHIIDNETFDTITDVKYLEKTRKIIYKKCPLGVFSISKPIFNKSFELAIIDIQLTGLSCIPSPLSYYKFKNSEWVDVNQRNIAFE